MKECKKCKEVMPLTDFSKDSTKSSGISSYCKPCKNKSNKVWQERNRDKIKEYGIEYYKNNKGHKNESSRVYYAKNKAERALQIKEWQRNNPSIVRAHNAKRRASKLQATPQWADLGKIQEVYTEAQRLTELLGIEMHVDHIVPLQGSLVSGLHVETNLQILPAVENLRKSNKFEVIL